MTTISTPSLHKTHSKSVSWHVDSGHHSLLPTSEQRISKSRNSLPLNVSSQNKISNPMTNNLDSITASPTPSHGIINGLHPRSASPSKRYRTRTKINPTPIATNPDSEFKFPNKKHSPTLSESCTVHSHSHSYSYSSDIDDAMTLVNITSPLSDISNSTNFDSPYIINSRPNLQEIFICLAHKERRVLEAREQLFNAENELSLFKQKWSSILNIPEKFSLNEEKREITSNSIANINSNSNHTTLNYGKTRKGHDDQTINEHYNSPQLSPITKRITSGQTAIHGLGINVIPYAHDEDNVDIDFYLLDDDLIPSHLPTPIDTIHTIRIDPTVSAPIIVRLLKHIFESIIDAFFGSLASNVLDNKQIYLNEETTHTSTSHLVKPKYPSITEKYYGTS